MKTVFLIALTLLTNIPVTEARSIRRELNANLTQFQLDPNFPLRHQATEGHVRIDLVERKIQVGVAGDYMTFPENIRPDDYFYAEVALKDAYVEKCNVAVYVGEERVGIRAPYLLIRKIEVRDNTRNTCPTFVPLEPTEVTVTEIEKERRHTTITAYSKMTGDALR